MIRLYQRLYRWASLIFSGPSHTIRPITSRRVVTVELEERVVVFRSRADQPAGGDRPPPEDNP